MIAPRINGTYRDAQIGYFIINGLENARVTCGCSDTQIGECIEFRLQGRVLVVDCTMWDGPTVRSPSQ